MSALEMLDVAIGIFFIYALLSLICTAIMEIIEARLKKRASDLERGIRELLNDSQGTGLSKELYQHPLVLGLYRGSYKSSGDKLPSYIPARNFALALMDVVLPAAPNKPSGAANPTAEDITAAAVGKATRPEEKAASAAAAAKPFKDLRSAVDKLQNADARQALLALLDNAGDDINKVRENIEGWYNSSMDRVSGWYKRRAQQILLFMGLLIAVAMNIDTIALFKSLSNDDALRDTIVAAAQEYAKAENQRVKATASDTTITDTPTERASIANPDTTNTTPANSAEPSNTKASVTDTTNIITEAPEERVERAMAQLQELRLPIGWDWDPTKAAHEAAEAARKKIKDARENRDTIIGAQDSVKAAIALKRAVQDSSKIAAIVPTITNRNLAIPANWQGWLVKMIGWLITGLAVSLGAPFWFDLLNKVMVIRSTVKPTEKSPNEASEDRQR